jgi:hypothetical protein
MNAARLAPELQRLAAILEARPADPAHWSHPGTPASWLRTLAGLAVSDPPAFWRELDSGRMWAGIGSVANQALAGNPGLPEPEWEAQQAALREGLAKLAEALRERARGNGGRVHPDLESWLSVFGASVP